MNDRQCVVVPRTLADRPCEIVRSHMQPNGEEGPVRFRDSRLVCRR